MKQLLAFFTLIYFLAPAVSQAAASKPVMLNGVDISAAVDFYSTQVSVLTAPVTVYNWSQDAAEDDSAKSERAQAWAKKFWAEYGTSLSGANSMYRQVGLIAAVDPIITNGYGGGQRTGWLLLEMKLPAGFKFLDLSLNQSIPANVLSILNSFTCRDVNYTLSSGGLAYSGSGASVVAKDCQTLMHKLFEEQIKIDAFAVGGQRWQFKDCVPGTALSAKIFTIVRSNWMKPELINYYTSKSTKDESRRTLIQSLFLPSPMTKEDLDAIQAKKISDYLAIHQDKNYVGMKNACYGNNCANNLAFCNSQKECEISQYNAPKEVTTAITSSEAATNGQGRAYLLWTDLEGKEKVKAQDQADWLTTSMYGCSGIAPIKPL